jgi:hypothetical protein
MTDKVNERTEWITHKGKRILCMDYTELAGEDLIRQIRKNTEDIMEIGEAGVVDQLHLLDVKGGLASREIVAAFKEAGTKLSPFIIATAVARLSPMQKRLLTVYNTLAVKVAQPFDTLEEAKDWLVEQANK